MAGQMRYTVFDKARRMWLAGFPGAKSARGVARWIDSGAAGNVVVRNAKGEAV